MPTPYVVGQWVREERFYGRTALLEEIFDGPRRSIWLLGTRRIGKTSTLKQLEHLATSQPERRLFPLFWDFQGAESVADLDQGFEDALLDALDRLAPLGLEIRTLRGGDVLTSIGNLRRELKARGLSLLLLGDEVEELVTIYEQEPRFLRRLRRALQASEGVRTVFASTIRLWQLAAEEATTSPFLAGFTPPLPLLGLGDEEARGLIRQSQLPKSAQPRFDDATVEAIRRRCHNHPYLLQLLSERVLELGDLHQATEAIAADPMVRFFFATDVAMLSELEREVLRLLARQDGATTDALAGRLAIGGTALAASLLRLELLAFVERSSSGVYSLPGFFFRRWLTEPAPDRASSPSTPRPPSRPAASRPATPREAAKTEQLRRIDQRYQLLALVGLGSSAEVWKARDNLLDTVVALKLLKPEVGLDEESLERLRREVVLSRDLSHPNILKVYHLGEDQGQRYITMQFIDGSDLGQVISREAPLSVDRALSITAKVAGALAALHRLQLLHRDIKPSNVLMGKDGEPRLSDFGLTRKQLDGGVTHHGMFVGTPRYASPEQVTGEELDERSDLYSLGVVLFEMVTGRPPFESPSVHELLSLRLRQEPPSPLKLVPTLPPALAELILRCLARERGERFQTAEELAAAIAGLGRG